MLDKPYFMNDKRWYKFDFDKRKYVLTESAPDEAKKTYEEYMEQLKKEHTRD